LTTLGWLGQIDMRVNGRVARALQEAASDLSRSLGYRGAFSWQAADDRHAPPGGVPSDGA
jgi:hypothetical protein